MPSPNPMQRYDRMQALIEEKKKLHQDRDEYKLESQRRLAEMTARYDEIDDEIQAVMAGRTFSRAKVQVPATAKAKVAAPVAAKKSGGTATATLPAKKVTTKKKMGRPVGSKNKPKVAAPAPAAAAPAPAATRPPTVAGTPVPAAPTGGDDFDADDTNRYFGHKPGSEELYLKFDLVKDILAGSTRPLRVEEMRIEAEGKLRGVKVKDMGDKLMTVIEQARDGGLLVKDEATRGYTLSDHAKAA